MPAGMKILNWATLCALVVSTVAATDVAPTNAELEGMYDKAFHAFDANNYVEALKELDAIDARKPDLAASQNLRGVIYMRQGLYDKAEAALSEAQRLDAKFWNARFNLAEIPFLKKDWAEARKRFQELLTSNAAELQGEATQLIQYKILLTYLLEGNDTMVDSILAKFELSPDTPAVHYANAAIALKRQNSGEAKNWIGAAEKNFSSQLNKLFAESLFEIGWLEKQAGQQRAALQLATPEERAAKTKTILRSQFEQAQQAYEQRDFDNAAKLAEQADAAEPNQPSILNLRGEILLEQQKFDEAETFFKKALKADPKFREAQFNLADVPFRKKEYSKARDRFELLFKQTPGGDKNQASQLIKFKIFMSYLLEGKDSRAQKLMEQFQFSGDTPALYYAQAAWEFNHGNADKANDWIASARKIYPLAANAAYGSGFYDLGWLKSAVTASSPSPAAAIDAAAVASAQNESSGPAVEPSPIPGVETKIADEGATQFSVAQAAAPSPVTGSEMPAVAPTSTPVSSSLKQEAPAVGPTKSETGTAAIAPTSAGESAASAATSPNPGSAIVAASPASTPEQSGALIEGGTANAPQTPTSQSATSSMNAANAVQPETSARPSAPVPATGATVASSNSKTSPAPVAGIAALASSGSEHVEHLAGPRTLLWVALLVGGLAALAWAVLPSIRRRIGDTQIGQRAAAAGGPDFPDGEQFSHAAPLQMPKQFSGGPRQISVQLRASEPSLRRVVMPLAKRPVDVTPTAEPEPSAKPTHPSPRGATAPFDEFSDSGVGPVIEQPLENTDLTAPTESTFPAVAEETEADPVFETRQAPDHLPTPDFNEFSDCAVGPVMEQVAEPTPVAPAEYSFAEKSSEVVGSETGGLGTSETEMSIQLPQVEAEAETQALATSLDDQVEPVTAEMPVLPSQPDPDAMKGHEAAAEMAPGDVGQPSPYEPTIQAGNVFAAETTAGSFFGEDTPEALTEPQPLSKPEPVLQGQPVPYQTVMSEDEPNRAWAASEPALESASQATADAVSSDSLPFIESSNGSLSQPTTTETMPETLQTPTAPVIRTSAGGTPAQPGHAAASNPQGHPGTGMHTAVQITLSCEIASMQLTPTFKMGALQLRPVSKVVTMRLAPSQQPQPAMNLQVNFELAKVQPASNSLGQLRLNPSQQQKPAALTTPSFNISGLQIVSGFEGAPVQLTPSQQGQASVYLTAAFQINTVEFSPSFDISAIILSSSSKTVSVQLPGAGASAIENAPIFEIANVQLGNTGEIAMLQLNPVGARRA